MYLKIRMANKPYGWIVLGNIVETRWEQRWPDKEKGSVEYSYDFVEMTADDKDASYFIVYCTTTSGCVRTIKTNHETYLVNDDGKTIERIN